MHRGIPCAPHLAILVGVDPQRAVAPAVDHRVGHPQGEERAGLLLAPLAPVDGRVGREELQQRVAGEVPALVPVHAVGGVGAGRHELVILLRLALGDCQRGGGGGGVQAAAERGGVRGALAMPAFRLPVQGTVGGWSLARLLEELAGTPHWRPLAASARFWYAPRSTRPRRGARGRVGEGVGVKDVGMALLLKPIFRWEMGLKINHSTFQGEAAQVTTPPCPHSTPNDAA